MAALFLFLPSTLLDGLGTAAVGDLVGCVLLSTDFKFPPQAGEGSFFLLRQKEAKRRFCAIWQLAHYRSGRFGQMCLLSADFKFPPQAGEGSHFLQCKKKQKGAFAPFGSLRTTATIATVHTHLYGRSNSLREFCSRARG